MFLKGKTAVISGSTSGIGLAYARALAAEGAAVMLNGFGDADAIEANRAALEQASGAAALYDPADMTKPDQIADMVREAISEAQLIEQGWIRVRRQSEAADAGTKLTKPEGEPAALKTSVSGYQNPFAQPEGGIWPLPGPATGGVAHRQLQTFQGARPCCQRSSRR